MAQQTRVIKSFKIDLNKIYTLTKVHDNGRLELKGIGECSNSHIEVGHGVIVANWFTSPVTFIEPTGKGICFETLNSTYVLEETSFKDEDLRDDSKE